MRARTSDLILSWIFVRFFFILIFTNFQKSVNCLFVRPSLSWTQHSNCYVSLERKNQDFPRRTTQLIQDTRYKSILFYLVNVSIFFACCSYQVPATVWILIALFVVFVVVNHRLNCKFDMLTAILTVCLYLTDTNYTVLLLPPLLFSCSFEDFPSFFFFFFLINYSHARSVRHNLWSIWTSVCLRQSVHAQFEIQLYLSATSAVVSC